MLDYEKLSHGLYDAASQALRLIEQEQQHCEEEDIPKELAQLIPIV